MQFLYTTPLVGYQCSFSPWVSCSEGNKQSRERRRHVTFPPLELSPPKSKGDATLPPPLSGCTCSMCRAVQTMGAVTVGSGTCCARCGWAWLGCVSGGEVGAAVCDSYIAYLIRHCVGGEVPPKYWLHLVRVLCWLYVGLPLLYAGVGSRSCWGTGWS